MSWERVGFVGGVNLRDAPDALDEDELVQAENIWPLQPGRLGRRKSIGCPDAGVTPAIVRPGCLVQYALNPEYVVGASLQTTGEQLLYKGLTLGNATGADLLSSTALQSGDYPPTMLSYPGGVIYLSGAVTESPKKITSSVGGVPALSTFTWATAQAVSVNPVGMCLYRNRFVYWFGGEYKNYIVFSDPDDPEGIDQDVLAANGSAFSVGGRGAIVACHEIMLAGGNSPASSRLLILFDSGDTYILEGEPGLAGAADPLGTALVETLGIKTGCLSPRTIVNTPAGTMWCGTDDVWLIREGALPRRVGSKIAPEFRALPRSTARIAWAYYLDNSYRLQLPNPEQDVTNFTWNTNYGYWLDLRGVEASEWQPRWWGPMRGGIAFDLRGNRSDTYLWGIFRDSRTGATYGIGKLGGSDRWLEPDNFPEIIPDVDEAYALIRTREMHFKDPTVRKLVDSLALNVFTNGSLPLACSYILDGGRKTASFTLTVPAQSAQEVAGGLVLDSTLIEAGEATLSEETKLVKGGPDPSIRYTCTKLQLEMVENQQNYAVTAPVQWHVRAISINVGKIPRGAG